MVIGLCTIKSFSAPAQVNTSNIIIQYRFRGFEGLSTVLGAGAHPGPSCLCRLGGRVDVRPGRCCSRVECALLSRSPRTRSGLSSNPAKEKQKRCAHIVHTLELASPGRGADIVSCRATQVSLYHGLFGPMGINTSGRNAAPWSMSTYPNPNTNIALPSQLATGHPFHEDTSKAAVIRSTFDGNTQVALCSQPLVSDSIRSTVVTL